MYYLIPFVVALAAVLSVTPMAKRIAFRAGFLDFPSKRKVHRKPTPLLGGLAILVGFFAAFLIGAELQDLSFSFPLVGFLLGAVWVFLVGLVDDRWGIGPLPKLLGQIVACAFLFFSGNTNDLITSAPLDLFFSFLWVVGLMNALNFLDNMDGIASGITFLASMGFFALAVLNGQVTAAVIAIALAGAALAFLRFNFHPASIFLGDAGSLLFGYVLASLGLMSTWHQTSYFYLVVPVLILGYPIFDVSFVVLTRIGRGSQIYSPGKDHTSHRLGTLLANVRGTALAVYAVCLFLAMAGVVLSLATSETFYLSALLLAALLFLLGGARLSRVPIQ
jgi:UDP-GlcNAc:undecaprenyl-phosphate GlcNAc-1-phosphate transferase